ncbi:hypothetical protein SUDANB67_05614 (plasmid) [Nocardiopsis dassonvillei]|uniref:hypothetical protein n=1 Tax=Nocardiopsis dassonvillei TaxID=2014 RepID=UPI00157CEBB2|nr:hypothetical protein [Nocardiopsis dassonvillei]
MAPKTPARSFTLPAATGIAIVAHFEALKPANRPGSFKMQLSYASAGYVDEKGEVKFDGVQRIKVTVYGALGRKVRDMLKTGDLKLNDRLIILPATINAFAFNGTNGPVGTIWAPACAIAFADGKGYIGEQEALAEVA